MVKENNRAEIITKKKEHNSNNLSFLPSNGEGVNSLAHLALDLQRPWNRNGDSSSIKSDEI